MGTKLSREQKIYIASGISVALITLFLLRKDKEKINTIQSKQSSSITSNDGKKGAIKSQGNILQQIANTIEVQCSPNSQILTIQTITSILEKSLELVDKEYIELTLKNRIQRRLIRKSDNSQYMKLVLEYNEQVESLLEKHQEDLCTQLQISTDQFQESAIQMMERGFFQQFYMIQASIRQKIKEKLQVKKQINPQMLKTILQFQVQLLKEKPKEMIELINILSVDPEQQQLIPLSINTMIYDYLFDQFRIEEEDLIPVIKDPTNLNNSDIQKYLQELEYLMYELIGPMQQL